MRKPKHHIPSTSWRKGCHGTRQRLIELRDYYLRVDKTNSNHTESLHLLNRTTVDIFNITKWLSDWWLGPMGCPKDGYVLVHLSHNSPIKHHWSLPFLISFLYICRKWFLYLLLTVFLGGTQQTANFVCGIWIVRKKRAIASSWISRNAQFEPTFREIRITPIGFRLRSWQLPQDSRFQTTPSGILTRAKFWKYMNM